MMSDNTINQKKEYKGGFSTGGFFLSLPAEMTEEDYQDFKALLEIVFRQIERKLKSKKGEN